ncbi:MAG: glycosyltransferase family 4 protein [bacterium]
MDTSKIKRSQIMIEKSKVMISFENDGQNGGPYVSHQRIMNSTLKVKYQFIPLNLMSKQETNRINRVKDLILQIKAVNPDIIHIHGLQMSGFYLSFAAACCKIPIVLVIHGSSSEAMYSKRFSKAIKIFFEIISLKLSTRVYAVSQYALNLALVQKYAKNKLYGTIYNLPAISNQYYDRTTTREELGLLDEIVIISSARIIIDKGYDVFCDVIIKLREFNNVKYIIAGDGSYLETMKSRLSEAKLSDRVIFLGFVKDIFKYYAASDIFMICTKHETLCNSLLEAGYMGLPLLASNVGGIPEIIEDGENGLLADYDCPDDFANKLRTLIMDEEVRNKFSKRIRETINKKFNEQTVIRQIDKLYKEVINGD